MEQCLVKPAPKPRAKPPKPPPKPAEINGNKPERRERPTPVVPVRPSHAELSKTQYQTKMTAVADNEANGNLFQAESKVKPSGSPVVPARPTEKELNATTRHSHRQRGSRETDQSEDTEVPKDEADFKQGHHRVLSGMFRKSQKDPSPSFTSYVIDDRDQEETTHHVPAKQTPGGKQGGLKGVMKGLQFRAPTKTNREPSPDANTQDPGSEEEASADNTKQDKQAEPKQDRGNVITGIFRRKEKEKEKPPPALMVSTADSDAEDLEEEPSEPSHEKAGFFSGILKKSHKPSDETPAQENVSQSELSASSDSLSENSKKDRGGIFSGMFKKSPKTSEAAQTEEDQQSLHSNHSASNDSLSDNSKEKGGFFSAILRKSPKIPAEVTPEQDKVSLHSELSASNDSLSENKGKGGLFGGLLRKTPKVQGDAQENLLAQKDLSASSDSLTDNTNTKDKRSLNEELSASNDSLSEKSAKEKGGLFSGMFRKSPKPEEDQESLHSELSASNESLSDNNKERGGLFSGLLKKTPKASGQNHDSQDKAQKELSASNDNLSENNSSKEKSIFSKFKKPQKQDEELEVNREKQSGSSESLSDTTALKEKKGALAGIFKRSSSVENLIDEQEKGGLFSGLLKKTPKASGDEAAAQDKDAQKELSASSDSLSENANTKEKSIFSGIFKKAPKPEEESNPGVDNSKLSVSCENLADTSQEKTGGLSGLFKRSPKPAPRSVATKDPLCALSGSCDSLTEAAMEDLSVTRGLSASNDSLTETATTKEKKGGFAGIFRRTPKALEHQESEDMAPPEGGSQLRRKRTIKKKRRVVSFRVKTTLPRIPKLRINQSSDTLPALEERQEMEMQELLPVQENTVEIQNVEMAAYPTEGNPLESEEESDGLMEWWNAVVGWAEWNETSNFQEEDEELAVEQVADRVFMAARLFVRLFNQRGAALQARILELLAQADAADQFHKRTVSAAVGGGVASVCGSVATITGLILAPFTFGASIIVTAVGISVATAGSITSATANITDTVHSNMDRKKVEKMIQSYQEEMKDIRECLDFVQEGMDTLQGWDFEKYSESAAKKALNHNIKHVMKEGGRAGKALMINTDKLISTVQVLGAAGGAAKAAQAISVTTGVMSALFLALDVFFLAKDSHELRKGAKTKFATKLREVCTELQDGLLELNKVKTQLQKTMDGIELEEYEEMEEVEVEVDDELESDPVKLAQLEQELDLMEEKLDKKVEEEQKKQREMREKECLESQKEKEIEKEKGQIELDDEERSEKTTKTEVSKEPSEKGRKQEKDAPGESDVKKEGRELEKLPVGDKQPKSEITARKQEKEAENQTSAERQKHESKREKAKEVTGKNKRTDEKNNKEPERSKSSRSGDSEKRKSDTQSERGISEREREKHRTERETREKEADRGSKEKETRESHQERRSSRDVERGVRDWRAEMAKNKEEKKYSSESKREMEKEVKREESGRSEVKRETSGSQESGGARREHSDRGWRREDADAKRSVNAIDEGASRRERADKERAEEKRGSKTESRRKQFERGEDGESQRRERDRRASDREREPDRAALSLDGPGASSRQGSRHRSKATMEGGLNI